MKILRAAMAVVLTGLGGAAQAATQHGLVHETVFQSITIQAEPAKVWALLSDFDGIARWNFAVERTVSFDGNQVALSRMVVFKDNIGKEEDVLDVRSDADMTMRYHVTSSSWPVTQYNVELHVRQGPAPGTSEVEWRGAFDVKGPSSDNASNRGADSGPVVFGLDIGTDADADSMATSKKPVRDKQTVKTITDQYRAGLDSLKWVLER